MNLPISSRSVYRIFATVAIITTILLLSAALYSQSCPANILHLPLNNPQARTVDCLTVEGREICSLWCTYTNRGANIDNLETADLKVNWVTSARVGAPILEDSCGPTKRIPNGIISPNYQVLTRFAGSSPALQRKIEETATELIMSLERSSVKCPGLHVQTNRNGPNDLPLPPGQCSANKPIGRVKNPAGKVEIYSYAFDKWKGPITGEFPIFPCDRVKTGYQSAATVYLVYPSGAEDRIEVRADTLMEIPPLTDEWEIARNTPTGGPLFEGYIARLVYGVIYWRTEPPGERRRREQWDEHLHIFGVHTPSIAVGVRGTEFILRHDPVTKKDYVFLNKGRVDVSTGGVKIVLEPGQQVYTENRKLSAVYDLKPEVWNALVARKALPGPTVFAGARQIETASVEKGNSQGKDGGKGKDGSKDGAPVGGVVNVAFQGRSFRTVYERHSPEGTPIDVYYFEIRAPDGSHAEQDGQKLSGRFVRSPAWGTITKTKDGVRWWYVYWIFKNGRWETITISGEPFEVSVPGK